MILTSDMQETCERHASTCYLVAELYCIIKFVIVIIKFVIFIVTSAHTIDHQFVNVTLIYNPSKQCTFNSIIVLGKIFKSVALMKHPVGVMTNCEKIAIL